MPKTLKELRRERQFSRLTLDEMQVISRRRWGYRRRKRRNGITPQR